jgi:hypothetical protein
MALALKQGTNGNLARFTTADAFDINVISARNTAAALTIGANLDSGQQVVLGNANADVSVLGDLVVAANINGGVGAGGVGSGVTDYFTAMWLLAVNDNGPDAAAYNLGASGTNAGAYGIGIDPTLLANVTATDLMTALDQLDAAIAGASVAQDTRAIENGVTIAAGDCVAVSLTASGRVTLADGASNNNPDFVGIAVTGGTGDAGGTVNCTFVLPGSPATVSGATFTVGQALYLPVGGGGAPATTATTTVGDLWMWVGWAVTATEMFISPSTGIVL